MAFETIERVGTPGTKGGRPPADGVRVLVRRAAARGTPVKYIALLIGPELARALVLRPEQVMLDIAIGNGRDAGHVGLAVNATSGGFAARRRKDGGYLVTINAASAEGLFSLEFEPFSVAGVALREAIGKPPMAVFRVSEAMLAVAD